MILFQSIRFRIIFACITFSLIVAIGYGAVVFYGVKYSTDELFNWYISDEATHLIKAYRDNSKMNLSEMTTANVFISDEAFAINQVAKYFQNEESQRQIKQAKTMEAVELPGPVFKTPQGYTIFEFISESNTVHVLKFPLEERVGQSFYYIVDVSGFVNYDESSEAEIINLFLTLLIVIIVVAILLSFFIAKMVVAPLTRLANSIDSPQVEVSNTSDDDYFDDEIGFLAKRIDTFVNQTKESVVREKAFSRDVSHELRTPLASSRAALELALSIDQGKSEPMNKFLQRIYRSNRDMTHLIETFLMLGREQRQINKSRFNLHDLVKSSFSKLAYLKVSETIQCLNHVPVGEVICESEEFLSIVIDNLIRNALQHTESGFVEVSFDNSTLVIRDSGEGMELSMGANKTHSVMEKSGVGLTIVNRLCEKQDWHLSIDSSANQGTRVSITFQ